MDYKTGKEIESLKERTAVLEEKMLVLENKYDVDWQEELEKLQEEQQQKEKQAEKALDEDTG